MSGPITVEPISIKLTGGKSGGCASKWVELASGDLRLKRFILIMSQKSTEDVLLQKIGGRPERKGVASNRAISEATSVRKANLAWPSGHHEE
jgi:hypothetical protein